MKMQVFIKLPENIGSKNFIQGIFVKMRVLKKIACAALYVSLKISQFK